MEKQYLIKVYRANGNYLTTWSDASPSGSTADINGGLGSMTFALARPFDNFGENNDVKLNNDVRVTVHDSETSGAGTLIYSGYISQYSPFIDGKSEGVQVTCLGYASKLASDIYKNGTTVAMAH